MFSPTGLARRAALVAVSMLALVACLAPAAARALPDRADDLPVTDGEVRTVVRTSDRIYIGGSFNHVATRTGPFFLADATGAPRLPTAEVSGGRDTVSAMAPDGAGGYYIVGTFTYAGGLPRLHAAHILADGSVDPNWVANVSGEVFTVAHSGNSVYIGGQFSSVDGLPRTNLAAVDVSTGQPTSFTPALSGSVGVLAVSGSSVYFSTPASTTVNGVARTGAAAVDAATGATTLPWNPEPNGQIAAIEVAAGKVFLGGTFTQIKGGTRKYLAAVDPNTGADTGFDAGVDGIVTALAVSGSTLYAGGFFTHAGPTAVGHAAAFDLNGILKPAWAPGADATVMSIATDGATVYLGGSFAHINGTIARSGFAAVDSTTGVATGWAPTPDRPTNFGHLVALSGSNVAVAGELNQAGGVVRRNAAAFDATDGSLLPWAPEPNGFVDAIAADGSGMVYIGGAFEYINGNVIRGGLAEVDATTGAATSFNIPAAASWVTALAIGGNTLYVGGQFQDLGYQVRKGLGAIDLTTDSVTPFVANLDLPAEALLVHGSTLYVGGQFNYVNGFPRKGAAAIPTASEFATPTAWSPNVEDVFSMAQRGGTIYLASGTKTVTAVDDTTGAPVPGFGLSVAYPSSAPQVDSVAVAGDTLYLGGNFETVNGVDRRDAAAVDATTGAVMPWNPEPNGIPDSISADPSGSVTIGGTFTTTTQSPVSGFASYSDPPAVTVAPAVSGDPVAGSTLTCAGFSIGGSRPQSTSFAWLRDGSVIAGATAQQLAVGAADVGHTLACRIIARNLGGTRSADSADITVQAAAAAAPAAPLTPRDRTSPKVSALTLTPDSFRAATKGGSIGAKAKKKKDAAGSGTVVSYKIDEAAKVTFTVQSPEAGRRRGKACVKATKKLAKAKHCTRYLPLKGTFTRTMKAAGTDRFTFTGRLGGKTLRKGSYRLSLVAVDAAGNKAAPATKAFRVTGAA